jgi:NSS family neurotransmitter:Na+ symporter
MPNQRERWASSTGFVLATIGSAVGLGNIWRFSYVTGENGGGAFLILYVLSVLLVGAPIVIAEMALGRQAGGDAATAFERAAPRSYWPLAGWLGIVGSCLILSYYAVIAGWALKYLAGSVLGTLWRSAGSDYGGYYARFIANPGEPVAWQMAMLAASMLVVMGGVQRGIEAVNRYLMPVLAVSVIGLAAYSATMPGASAGWLFLFAPDWSALSDPDVILAALGQSFFSLGVGMAVYVTYASYMSPRTRIPLNGSAVIFGDTLFAIVAGLAIFPAVFAFGMSPEAGPKLAFITLPQIFLAMPAGKLIGALFFLLLSAAALTSMVSLLEVPVAAIVHRTPMRRWGAVLVVGLTVFVAGIPLAMSYGALAGVQVGGRGMLDALDQIVSNYVLPVAGLLVALFVGWRWGAGNALAAADLEGSAIGRAWIWLLRIVVPFVISLILLNSVMGA